MAAILHCCVLLAAYGNYKRRIRGFVQVATLQIPSHIDGLVQERRNSSASEMVLRLSCTNPSIYSFISIVSGNQELV